MKSLIIDCVTFFQEKRHFELRYNILKDVVDKFIICESIYDHRGKRKKINFDKKKYLNDKNVIHLLIKKKFPISNIPWQNQALQREYIYEYLKKFNDDDYIMFSDPDEIPNPKILKKLNLNKKYGIFLQKIFSYKLNLYNSHESPWEGTRICKKKFLKSIDWLRHKVVRKNLKYPFWRIDKEKNIQIIKNGGWHFSYLLTTREIAKKFRSLAEISWDKDEYLNLRNIQKKIKKKVDLFERGHKYKKVKIDSSFPKYIRNNLSGLRKWII